MPSLSGPAHGLADGDMLGWSYGQMERVFFAAGIKPVHAGTFWCALHRAFATSIEGVNRLPVRVRAEIAAAGGSVFVPGVMREAVSTDGLTRKFLLRLADGENVETVIMRFSGRLTACLSTQAGCAMGCVFCATGQAGFRRNLSAGEIVAQALHVGRVLAAQGEKLRNIVLMGQGEPLHNYDAVMSAVENLVDARGLALAARRVTLSTVGLVPGIRRLADEKRPVSLAVSLHGATDEERAALVPIARRWRLAELMDACGYFSAQTGERIFFEWTLIDGCNDGVEHARKLGALLRGQRAQVNLIPLNPTEGFAGGPAGAPRVKAFQRILREFGIPSTVRQRRGIDIAAGCGQLAGAMAH